MHRNRFLAALASIAVVALASPALADAIDGNWCRADGKRMSIEGPAIVVGMFSGDGLHGARDAPRLIAQLGRPDVVYAGVIGSAPGIADMISRSVRGALDRR